MDVLVYGRSLCFAMHAQDWDEQEEDIDDFILEFGSCLQVVYDACGVNRPFSTMHD